MSDINAMSKGIADNLATISGIRTYAEIPDNVNLPAAIVNLNSVIYDQAFQGGLVNYNFVVTVIVSRVTERRAQSKVYGYVQTGTAGVKAAIESDPTLNGAAIDTRVTEMTNIQPVSIGDIEYLTADFAVIVRAE